MPHSRGYTIMSSRVLSSRFQLLFIFSDVEIGLYSFIEIRSLIDHWQKIGRHDHGDVFGVVRQSGFTRRFG